MARPQDLAAYLCDNRHSIFSAALLRWLESSPRFTAFAETYRDKIRKKIRLSQEPATLLDLQSELGVAYCLLGDRRFSVAYEPYASLPGRGPDFAVTYRANTVFNLEVARLRWEENPLTAEPGNRLIAGPGERVLRILLNKLGQMQPGKPNLLVIHTRPEAVEGIGLEALLQFLKARAESRDPLFTILSGYPDPAAFYKDFLHFTALLLWSADRQISSPDRQATAPDRQIPSPDRQLWLNKQARPALDDKILRLIVSLPCPALNALER